jgi:hypothetical protein
MPIDPKKSQEFGKKLLGYDPVQDELQKLALEKMKQNQLQQQQLQQPINREPASIPMNQPTGMQDLNLDAARDTFFTNLRKLIGQ